MATKVKSTESDQNVIRFAFLNETKGALRFQEVDTSGNEVPADKMKIGSLYFRKATFGKMSAEYASNGTIPKVLVARIEVS